MKAAGNTKEAIVDRLTFTVGGLLTSGIVGVAVALLGRLFPLARTEHQAAWAGVATCVLLIGRELFLSHLPLPQLRRQTSDRWGKMFPGPVAAGVWGLDIGLGVATYITFSGYWLPLVLAFLFQTPTLGALLMWSYWLGRALPVWVLPGIVPSAADTMALLDAIDANRRTFGRFHMIGLLLGLASLGMLALAR